VGVAARSTEELYSCAPSIGPRASNDMMGIGTPGIQARVPVRPVQRTLVQATSTEDVLCGVRESSRGDGSRCIVLLGAAALSDPFRQGRWTDLSASAQLHERWPSPFTPPAVQGPDVNSEGLGYFRGVKKLLRAWRAMFFRHGSAVFVQQ
jgi:hypothetical protein